MAKRVPIKWAVASSLNAETGEIQKVSVPVYSEDDEEFDAAMSEACRLLFGGEEIAERALRGEGK